jgi:hypothetical protein
MSTRLSIPAVIPSHFGSDPVHHNDVLRNRAKARKLWRMMSRRSDLHRL